jgi:NADPH:quinone reductase-like Zn-dependent oxidoreductase
VKIAAAMNPAMSSWVGLRRRGPLEPGQSVLILGATGSADAMAIQVAKWLGAGRVVGAGRDEELPSLIEEINAGTIAVKANTMPLANVERIWTRADAPGERAVLLP